MFPFRSTSPQPVPGPTQPFAAAAEQAQHLLGASVRTWAEESRAFLDEMVRDNVQALQALQGCATPFEVMAVEQKWLMLRTGACFEAGLRLALGAICQAEDAAAEAVDFHLPD